MPLLPKPNSFKDEHLQLLKWLALNHPGITGIWRLVCPHLILQATGKPIFDTIDLMNYSREKCARLTNGLKTALADESYDPFKFLLQPSVKQRIEEIILENQSKMSSSTRSKRSAKNKSKSPPRRSNVSIDAIAEDLKAVVIKGSPKGESKGPDIKATLAVGINHFDGYTASLVKGKQSQNNKSWDIVEIIMQLPQGCAHKNVRSNISAKLSVGSKSTCVIISVPETIEFFANDIDKIQTIKRKAYGDFGVMEKETKALFVKELHDEQDKGMVNLVIQLKLPTEFEYSNKAFNLFYNNDTKAFDTEPEDDFSLLPIVHTSTDKMRWYVVLVIPIDGSDMELIVAGKTPVKKDAMYEFLEDDEQEEESFHETMES